jgi:pimeloyl-ACP methyl ester carboxylesterase
MTKDNGGNEGQVPDYYISVLGLKIHYKQKGEGEPVILIHGAGNDWHEWEDNILPISRKFRVYAPDLPGFGASEMPGGTVSLVWMCTFIKEYMKAIGVESAHLMGVSLGGTIALAFAADYPEMVRKVIILDTIFVERLPLPSSLLLRLIRFEERFRGILRGPRFAGDSWMIKDRLSAIRAPTLIVWGKRDIYLPVSHARIAAALIPRSRLCLLDCGHAPERECPEEFNRLAGDFLLRGVVDCQSL